MRRKSGASDVPAPGSESSADYNNERKRREVRTFNRTFIRLTGISSRGPFSSSDNRSGTDSTAVHVPALGSLPPSNDDATNAYKTANAVPVGDGHHSAGRSGLRLGSRVQVLAVSRASAETRPSSHGQAALGKGAARRGAGRRPVRAPLTLAAFFSLGVLLLAAFRCRRAAVDSTPLRQARIPDRVRACCLNHFSFRPPPLALC